MQPLSEHRNLIKFLVGAAIFLCVGTVQGVLQVLPPIRVYLDSIGSPISGPGHMIDPLAHAHINIVGGVVLISMAVTYYLLQVISGRPVWSRRLIDHTFWWTAIGVSCFYSTLIVFGIIEGNLLLSEPSAVPGVHHYYGLVVSVVSTVMGVGFWVFLVNVFLTAKHIYKRQ